MATIYNNLVVLAVCAHYILKTGDLKKMTLVLKEIDGLYTGENLATIIYGITEDWGVSANIGYFVMDNVVVNDKMLKEYSIRKLMPYKLGITCFFLILDLLFILFSIFDWSELYD
jgi:hypothetical protein